MPWIETITAYRLIRHLDPARFEHLVNAAIADGFEPIPAFAALPVDGTTNLTYLQPMVKRVRVEE